MTAIATSNGAPRPFRNNLVQGDRVLYVPTNRYCHVAWSPRKPDQRMTAVVFDGTKAPQYFDVMLLRLDPDGDGKPEDEAPVDGTPPAANLESIASVIPPHPLPPKLPDIPGLAELRRTRDSLDVQIRAMEADHLRLRGHRDKLSAAIEILDPAKKIEVPRVGVA